MPRGRLVFLLCVASAWPAGACDEPPPDSTATPAVVATDAAHAPTSEPYIDAKATEQARATPTATPARVSPDCPTGSSAARACDAANDLVADLRVRGAQAIVDRAQTVTVSCARVSVSTETLCMGATASDSREGFAYANKVFRILPSGSYREHIGDKLKAASVVGIGCPQTEGRLDCSERFVIALDPTPTEPPDTYRLTVLLVEWDGNMKSRILANYGGLYASRSAWAGGPGRYPLPEISDEAVTVWWYPWRSRH